MLVVNIYYMKKATFVCPKCGKTEQFELPLKEDAICKDCKIKMNRQYKNIKNTDVVTDEFLDISQKMLYS